MCQSGPGVDMSYISSGGSALHVGQRSGSLVVVPAEESAAATRYMCAGAHLDEGFAERVVQEVEEEYHRAFAPSYGANIKIVHQHARRALRRVHERNERIGYCLLASFLLQPLVTLVLWPVVAVLAGSATPQIDPRPSRLARLVPGRTSSSLRVQAVGGALFRVFALVLVELLVTEIANVVPAPLVWIHGTVPTALSVFPLLVVFPWVIAWNERSAAWRTISGELTGTAFSSKYLKSIEDRDNPTTDGNITVYSGYSPFVGSGTEIRSWDLTLNLAQARPLGGDLPQPRESGEPWAVPVTADELIVGLGERLAALGSAADGSPDGVAGLSVTEKLFVEGTVLRRPGMRKSPLTAAVLPDEKLPPVLLIPPEIVQAYRGHHQGPVRHCLRIQVTGWGADLVLSVFLHVAISGGTLYLESTTLVLPPVREAYRVADSVAESRSSGVPSAEALTEVPSSSGGIVGAQALGAGLKALAGSPASAYRAARAPRRKALLDAELLRSIKEDMTFDYGARLSLRELAAGSSYRNYFQRVDVARIRQLIDKRTLDFLAGFLSAKGLDTSELDDRRTTILNSGILMTGGYLSGTIVAGEHNTVNGSTAAHG